MTERLIGIDAGGSVTKAALFDLDGREHGCAHRPNTTLYPAPGQTERDPDAMWQAACGAVRDLLDATGTDPDAVAGLSVTGYGSGLWLVDADGRAVRPGIGSTDSRAAGLLQGWQASGLADRAGDAVQQRFWAGQTVVLLAWLAEHEPETVARTASVLLCKDYLRLRFCGDCSTDGTDAGISGLWDVRGGTWATELMEALGLGVWLDKLPEVRDSAEVAGPLSGEAARLTGLNAGTPVIRGLVDVAASCLASGVDRADRMSVVAGTFSINQTLHTTPRLSYPPFLQCVYPLQGYYLATEGGATSASNLEWVCRTLLDGEAEQARLRGESIYDVCNRCVVDEDGAPGNDILFFPFLFGTASGAPAGLLGLSAAHGFCDVVRAIFEGIVFAHRADIDRLLAGHDAAEPAVVRLAGGASRSDPWVQMFADVLEKPVEITHGSEFGALGASIISSVALGLHADVPSAVTAMVKPARRREPRPEAAPYYRAKYARYRAIAAGLSDAWAAAGENGAG